MPVLRRDDTFKRAPSILYRLGNTAPLWSGSAERHASLTNRNEKGDGGVLLESVRFKGITEGAGGMAWLDLVIALDRGQSSRARRMKSDGLARRWYTSSPKGRSRRYTG